MADSTANAILKVYDSEDVLYEEREILSFNFIFSQDIDSSNRPSGKPSGGKIYIKVLAKREESNIKILKWMTDATMKKNFEIVVFKPGTTDTLITYKFFDTYCVDYKQNWEDANEENDGILSFYEELGITWRYFKADDTDIFSYAWKLPTK